MNILDLIVASIKNYYESYETIPTYDTIFPTNKGRNKKRYC